MENKFLVAYDYDVPGPNNARGPGKQFLYEWTCHDTEATSRVIYGAELELNGLSCVPGNMSEVIDLSFDKTSRRPVGSRRNYLGLFDTYQASIQPAVSSSVRLKYGRSEHPMRQDMEKLIGTSKPVAIQMYKSPTCIAEAAGYYADL